MQPKWIEMMAPKVTQCHWR